MDIEEPMKHPVTPWIRSCSLWLVLFSLCFLIQGLGLEQPLRFDRQAVDQGQLWRLLSAHLVHLNSGHLWMNMAGLALVVMFFRRYYMPPVWLMLLVWCGILTGLGLYVFNPRLYFYVGLSGVLHGLFIAGAWQERRHYPLAGHALLVLIGGKLIWEQWSGPLPGSESMAGGAVAVDAHLYGALAGLVFVLLHQLVHVHDGHEDGQHDHQHHDTHGDDQ